jgi:hypothetical protein
MAKCKHNWHYVGTETFRNSGIKAEQFATFICDQCGKTKVLLVNGFLNKSILNKLHK